MKVFGQLRYVIPETGGDTFIFRADRSNANGSCEVIGDHFSLFLNEAMTFRGDVERRKWSPQGNADVVIGNSADGHVVLFKAYLVDKLFEAWIDEKLPEDVLHTPYLRPEGRVNMMASPAERARQYELLHTEAILENKSRENS